ncbi:MAG: hypothetical protein QXR82_06120 [Candidatus Bathyarchaeia archaeon]
MIGFWELILILFVFLVLIVLPSVHKREFNKLKLYGVIFALLILASFLVRVAFFFLGLIILLFTLILLIMLYLIKR